MQYIAPLKKACVRGERAGTERFSARDRLSRLHAATPTENETCGNFGGPIAWYGNLIARQTIRYEVPRGLFLTSDWSVHADKIVILRTGYFRTGANLWLTPDAFAGHT